MLQQLVVKNYAIIESITLDFNEGLTTITGETGAGKSIMMDALSLVLGGRASAECIRSGAPRCEVTAYFSLSASSAAHQWLKSHEMDEQHICILRRTIRQDGRSQLSINGTPATLTQVKELAEHLVHRQSQHHQLQLLKPQAQRELLDQYGQYTELLDSLKATYQAWSICNEKIKALTEKTHQGAEEQLLDYQVSELNELALTADEYTTLDEEHKRLSHSEELLTQSQHIMEWLNGESNQSQSAEQLIAQSLNALNSMVTIDPSLIPAQHLLQEAHTQITEAALVIRDRSEHINSDPERLQAIEQRLTQIHRTADKHRVKPAELIALHHTLAHQLKTLKEADSLLDTLNEERARHLSRYEILSKQLTDARVQCAMQLSSKMTSVIQELAMPHARLSIAVETNQKVAPSPYGNDRISFNLMTNPGQPEQPLQKAASGGELSRVALAIYVVSAARSENVTLLFDEVDVGIGGATAECVGKRLRELSATHQVISITHQPQVAVQGHQQLKVTKQTRADQTYTQVLTLRNQARIDEIARMLTGTQQTQHALNHAKALLDGVS